MKWFALTVAAAVLAAMCLAQNDSTAMMHDSSITNIQIKQSHPCCVVQPHRWEIGFRATSLYSFPGYATFGWCPTDRQLLEVEISGNYNRRNTGSYTTTNGAATAAVTWRHRIISGKHFEVFGGVRPGFKYDFTKGETYSYSPKTWNYRYMLDFPIGTRRMIRLWNRSIAVELSYCLFKAYYLWTKERYNVHDTNGNVIGQKDATESIFTGGGDLNGQLSIGMKYCF
jgi:hypothetical protein